MPAENPPTSPVPTPARRPILGFPFAIATLALLAWQILRITLWIRFAPDNLPWRQTLEVLGNGVFGDVAFAILGSGLLIGLSALLATILSLPALLVQAFGPAAWRPTWRWLFRVAITVGFMTGIFLLVSEWYFFAEFESRFNTVAIDYLIYPHEVFTNLRESYPLPAIVLLCAVGGLTLSLLTFRRWPPAWESATRTRRTFATAAWIAVGLAKTFEYWSGEPGSGTMSRSSMPDPSAESLRDDGIALFQVADELYTAGRFNLPPTP